MKDLRSIRKRIEVLEEDIEEIKLPNMYQRNFVTLKEFEDLLDIVKTLNANVEYLQGIRE